MLASASGEAVARIYNLSHRGEAYPSTVPLSTDVVWDAFWLYALLLWSQRTEQPLVVPHSGEHKDRWTTSLSARNVAMAGTGQALWAHACDQCEKIIYEPGEQEGSHVPISSSGFYFLTLSPLFPNPFPHRPNDGLRYGRRDHWPPSMQRKPLSKYAPVAP